MNKRENPYTPGAGRKPPTLAGRDRDLESFQALIERLAAGGYERSQIYSGLRGVGKTVLLMELDVLATEAGWATTDVQEVGSQPDFRVTFARMAARLLHAMSRRHRVKERAERALGVVKAFSAAVPGGVQLKLDVQASTGVADSGDPEQDLTDLLREIGEVARTTGAGRAVSDRRDAQPRRPLARRDLHRLPGDQPPRAARRDGRRRTTRPQVRLMSAKPYADRLFSYHELGRLPGAAARAALIAPAAARGVAYDEDAARRVVRASAGYPYFIQEYGLELWNHAETSPIAMDDVAEVSEIVTDSLARNFFATRLQLASDTEQRYLAAMASLGDPPYRSADVARSYGAKDQRGVSVHRDNLIQKGLVWSPRRGQLEFTVPLFAEYLRDSHPLSGFDE